MSFDWRECEIKELCTVTSSKRIFAHDYVDNGIPFYASKDVIEKALGSFTGSTVYISNDRFFEVARKFGYPSPGDLLLSSVGNRAGIPYVVQDEGEFYFKDGNITWFKDFSSLNSIFLCYWLKSKVGQAALSSIMIGSAQKALTISGLLGLKIRVPSLPTQDGIVSILKSLDDRIILLRETNATLEAIAQALFKSWFVDFDPVFAKARGFDPEGMGATAAALFPDSFEESELGLVPRGWTEIPLGQLCSFQKGCSYKGDGLSDDQGAYMFNLGCFNAPRVFAFEKLKRYTGDFRDKHRVSGGDLIIANTDMTQHRAILGRPLLVPDGIVPGFVSHHVFKVIINQKYGKEIKHFLFFCFLQPSFRERAVGYATGTTVLGLPKDALEQHLINFPGHELIKEFANCCEPIFSSIQANEVQAQNLTQLRDTLLPRLISGQLRLPETDASVESTLSEAV